jgi:putative hydrolase of the HAD superfamily
MNDVLCRYDREARIGGLARACGKTPSFVEAAIWRSGYEDLGDTGAMDADGYLSGFAERLGGSLTLEAWSNALRAAVTPLPKALELAGAVGRRARVAVLTNNNLLVAREIDSIFPELSDLRRQYFRLGRIWRAQARPGRLSPLSRPAWRRPRGDAVR